MPLLGDPTVTKLQKDSNVVSQLAIGREVLNLDCGNASPVHLQRNPVTVPQNVRDRVGLADEQLLTTPRGIEGFRKVGD
jgi:hypothetical protein